MMGRLQTWRQQHFVNALPGCAGSRRLESTNTEDWDEAQLRLRGLNARSNRTLEAVRRVVIRQRHGDPQSLRVHDQDEHVTIIALSLSYTEVHSRD
jgi:hypothetical protein